MSSPHPLPPKKEVALALLERSSVHVHLDPRATGVVVPQWFKKQPQLVLQIGLNMPVPIPDLRLDDDGLSCTLSFNRAPFYCLVPWPSVYAMVGDDGRGMVWPDDVPAEVVHQAKAREGDVAKKAPAKRGNLAPVARLDASPGTRLGARPGARLRASPGGQAPGAGRAAPSGAPAKPERHVPEEAAAKAPGKDETKKKPRKRSRPDEHQLSTPPAENVRGMLAAVPPPSPPAPVPGAISAPKRPAPQPASPAKQPSPPPVQAVERRPNGARPKRELPPYLRVVK